MNLYCIAWLQNYELQLASYSAGLETLLNVPIKRTMLQSPADVVRDEVGVLLMQLMYVMFNVCYLSF